MFGFARTWKAVKGEDLELVSLGSVDDLAAETYRRLQATPHDMYACLPLMYARGVFGGQALLGDTLNARYPDIAAEDLAAAMGRGAV